jgi:fucose 4-O-acetylase-like acetyltransferase
MTTRDQQGLDQQGLGERALAPRDPYWDNAKAILVTLVVVGHALARLASSGNGYADVAYRWIYLFHMPAFVFVTGILTAELTTRRAGRLVTGLLVPYALFQVLQAVEVSILRGEVVPLHPLSPRWTLWFLLAVVLWRLSAPMWIAMRPLVALALAVTLYVLGGLGSGVGQPLALDNVIGFLPFFVAGLLVRRRFTFERPPRAVTSWLAGAVLLGALAAIVLTRGAWSRTALQLGTAADALGTTDARATLLRLALLIAAGFATWAVLTLVPRGEHWWTAVGRASMYVYLLHPLVLIPFRTGGDLPWPAPLSTAVVIGCGILLALVLATPLVRQVTRWAVEPGWARVLVGRKDQAERPAASA